MENTFRFERTAAVFTIVIFLLCFMFMNVASAQTHEEEWARAVASFDAGQKQRSQGDIAGAIVHWETALSILRRLDEKQAIGMTVGKIGEAYSDAYDFRKAIPYHEEAVSIADALGDKKSKGGHLADLGLAYQGMGDFRKAIPYHEKAIAVARETANKKEVGRYTNNLGNVYRNMGEYEKAIDCYGQAMAMADEIGNKDEKENPLGNQGNVYTELHDYPKALSYYEQALAIAEETGNKKGKAGWLGNVGVTNERLGEYRKALSYYARSLAINEEIGDKSGIGRCLNNMGNVYTTLGDFRKAISHHEKSLAIDEEIGNIHGKGMSLNNLGNAYKNLGDYEQAVRYYKRAIVVCKEGDTPCHVQENNLGDAFLALDRDDDAYALYRKHDHPVRLGRYALKKKNYPQAKTEFSRDLALVEESRHAAIILPHWIGLGLASEGLKQYEKAYEWYTKAITFMEDQRAALTPAEREHYFEGEELGIPRIEAYEGAVRSAFMRQQFDQAFFWAENTRGRILSELLSRRHAGDDTKVSPQLAQLEEDLTTKIMMNKKQQQTAFEKSNPTRMKQLEKEYDVLKGKMDQLIDLFRKDYPQYASIKYPQPIKLSQLALKPGEVILEYEVTDPYTVGLVIRDGKVIKAFKVDKTRKELEALVGKFRAPFKDDQRINEFSLTFAREMAELLLKPSLSLLRNGERLIIIPDECLSLIPFESLLLAAPAHVLQEEAVLLAQAKSRAQGDTMTDKQGIIRGLTPMAETRGRGLSVSPRVTTQIRFDAGSARSSKGSLRQMEEIAAALKDAELKEAAIRIEGHTDSMGDPRNNLRLSRRRAQAVNSYLVKNGIQERRLSSIGKGDTEPVADNATPEGRRRNRRVDFVRILETKRSPLQKGVLYALDAYPISYYQSASVLSLQRGLQANRMKAPSFFGLGDPVFDREDQRLADRRSITITAKNGTASTGFSGQEEGTEAGYRFSRLKNTEKEVREVSALFPGARMLIGSEASKDNLRKENLASRRYVLFSTHGILGNEIPYIRQPALVLNLVGNKAEDGFLTATEIFQMTLNADLVGLSACQTGLGVQAAGEGVVGLSRAFMYAGTDSVLVSLWSVSDESTYKLMVKFFQELKQGKDKITALREAKNYLRANGYDHPFFWAPFILVGEAN